MYVANRLPDIGESIGDYKVVEVLGRGGHGVVFRVERGMRSYVAKFLLAPDLDGRAKREISVLNHLNNPCVVRYIGSDFWPNPVTGRPYIIMEYVPGDTLEAFAFRMNPSARKATRIVLDIARTLGEIHGVGVFHRDLKPTNIVIRGAAERPVLIDFGIAALAGASCLTGTRIPPATHEYRAPDPLRFERNNPGGKARYEFGPTDELWALGVTFYWLLTDELPFGERTDDGGEEGLHERILTQRPIAPHAVNPRVPLAASHLCMTMLAEWSADRVPTVPKLCRALQEALATAEDDRAWDVPLVDPHDPQANTTVEDPALVEPNEQLGDFRRQGKRRPRRGLLRPNEALASVASSVPVEEPEQDQLPTVAAPGSAARPGVDELPAAMTQLQASLQGLKLPAPVVTRVPPALWRLGLVATLLAVAVGVLHLSADAWGPGTSSPASAARTRQELPSMYPTRPSTEEDAPGREMAPFWEPPDSIFKVSAAPFGAQPPASPAIAMSSKLPQTLTTEAPKSQIQRAAFRLGLKPATVAAAVVACTGPGCTGTSSQVRPEPPTLNCPQGWEAMNDKLGIGGGTVALKGTKGEGGERTQIHPGPVTALVDSSKLGLPRDTLLFGTWRIEEDRIYATFTQAQVPGSEPVPVCLVVGEITQAAMFDEQDKEVVCPPGLGTCPLPGSRRDNVKAYSRIRVYSARQRF